MIQHARMVKAPLTGFKPWHCQRGRSSRDEFVLVGVVHVDDSGDCWDYTPILAFPLKGGRDCDGVGVYLVVDLGQGALEVPF